MSQKNIIYSEEENMTIIPMRDLKDTVEVERRCAQEQGPVFVTKNGYGKLVVMDIEYFDKLVGKLYEAKMIGEGLDDINAGKVKSGEDVKRRLAEKNAI